MTSTNFTAQAARKAVLARMGTPEGAELFTWPTASAAWSRAQGALWIAADLEVAPEDWESVCLLLELTAFDNGTDGPWKTDPGEGTEVMGLATWSLSLRLPVS